MEKDITGLKFNHLTAIRRVYGYTKRNDNYWEFECDCEPGKKTIAKKYDVLHNNIVSCGCYMRKRIKERPIKHGGKYSRLYRIWISMKQRCNNPNNPAYKNYGERGIKVCCEWEGENGFSNFRQWALSNGYDENANQWDCTIDRKDNNLGYSPQNCRWVNMECQCNNRRNVKPITAFGETHSVGQWSKILGIGKTVINDRLYRQNLKPEDALTKCDRRRKDANG